MFGSDVLDVAVGMVVVYLLFALVVSTLQELVARAVSLRSATLRQGLERLLDEPSPGPETILARLKQLGGMLLRIPKAPIVVLEKLLRVHRPRQPLTNSPNTERVLTTRAISGLGSTPSYISATVFRRALFEGVNLSEAEASDSGPEKGRALADAIEKSLSGEVAKALEPLAREAEGDLRKFNDLVEDWFDDQMTRVSGWYKRKAQLIMLGLALIVAFLFNVDSIQLVRSLQTDPAIREALVDAVPALLKTAEEQIASDGSADETSGGIDASEGVDGGSSGDEVAVATTNIGPSREAAEAIEFLAAQLDSRTLPFGRWIESDDSVNDPLEFPSSAGGWLYKVLGILITTAAIALGAPFWFDVLNKIVNLRGTGGKPLTAAEARVASAGPDSSSTAGETPGIEFDKKSEAEKRPGALLDSELPRGE